jgi:hypothetical protein
LKPGAAGRERFIRRWIDHFKNIEDSEKKRKRQSPGR